MEQKNTSQNGNAIVMIMVAIALFAALAYAFNSTSRSSSNFVSDEQASAYANQILAYGREVKSAVKRLQLRGCSETEISFENNEIAGYTNTNAPNDKSCHVFDIAGGGLQYITPSLSMLESDHSTYDSYGESFYANKIQVVGVGTSCATGDCTELTMHIPHLKPSICQAINKSININNVSESITDHEHVANDKFIGIYEFITTGATSTIADGTGANALPSGLKNGCIERSDLAALGEPFNYFHVLIVR